MVSAENLRVQGKEGQPRIEWLPILLLMHRQSAHRKEYRILWIL